MRKSIISLIHVKTGLVKMPGLDSVTAMAAENLVLKYSLVVVGRSRRAS